MNTIDEKRKKLREDLDRMDADSGDAWQKMKTGIDAAWDDLKKATDEAAKEFE